MTPPIDRTDGTRDMQVFTPVPTESDMMALSQQVRQARSGQARMLITAIFLSGILVAGIAGAVFAYGQMQTQLKDAGDKIAAQAKDLKARDEQIAGLETKITAQQATIDSYADYQSIMALQKQGKALENDIADLLAEPSRANATARLRKLPPDVEWLDDVVSKLRDRRDALETLKADVEAWPPIPQSPRPD